MEIGTDANPKSGFLFSTSDLEGLHQAVCRGDGSGNDPNNPELKRRRASLSALSKKYVFVAIEEVVDLILDICRAHAQANFDQAVNSSKDRRAR